MTIRKFNVKAGLSVGPELIDVIDATGNGTFNTITANAVTTESITATAANITLTGNLTVVGTTDLGNLGNIIISGGNLGDFLQTDGNGVLTWTPIAPTVNVPYISWTATAGETTFVSATLADYPAGTPLSIFRNGVLMSPSEYSVSGDTLTVSIYVSANDLIEIPSKGVAGSSSVGYADAAGVAYSVSGSNVSGAVATANFANFAGNVTVNAQPNITSVGTLTSLTVSGNANIGNLNVTGNVTGNLLPNANVTYNLGSSTQRWKDIWLSNSTIYIGSQTISAGANGVILSGDTTVPNITADETGNVSITGNMIPTADGQTLGTATAPWSSAYFDGTITANTFTGNGSQLTGISAATVSANAQPNITSVGTLTTLTTSGDVLVGGNLTVNGTTTTVHSTEVAIDDKNIILAANATTQAQANGGGITINGASATMFYKSADDTWNFNKQIVGNLTGTASTANLATYATTANSVAGANVTGTVANATYATTAGSATTSTTANSVAGANVTGTVANATYATTAGSATTASTANSVAAANITGTVSFATLSATANTVAGANVTGTVANATYATTAGSVSSIAGANVTGTVANATYATTSGSSTTAATVTTNAQPNITSLGSLTALTVNGNITANGSISLKAYTDTVVDPASSATFAPDLSTGTIQRFTANSNFTFNSFTNPVAGQSAMCIITQDGTGSRLMTSTMKFAGNSKTLSTAAGSVDIIAVFYDGSSYYASLTKGYA